MAAKREERQEGPLKDARKPARALPTLRALPQAAPPLPPLLLLFVASSLRRSSWSLVPPPRCFVVAVRLVVSPLSDPLPPSPLRSCCSAPPTS